MLLGYFIFIHIFGYIYGLDTIHTDLSCISQDRNLKECLQRIELVLDLGHSQPFISPHFAPSIYLEVQFTTKDIEYTVCCKHYSESGQTVVINPLSNTLLSAALARTESDKQFNLFKDGPFLDEMYTIVMVDPDVPSAKAGTPERPFLHMLMVNIRNGDTSTGKALNSYAGPLPPDSRPHSYTFLVYKQSEEFNYEYNIVQKGYTFGCPKCLFDIQRFVKEEKLTLVGVSWMRVQNSPYVDSVYISRGRSSTDFCSTVEGWSEDQGC